jgi:hypothetical protein
MRQLSSICIGALLAGCQATSPSAPQPSDYRLVDLTAAYSRAFDETANLPDTERAAVVKERLSDKFRQFYQPRPATPESQQRFDGRIAASLNQFPALRPKYEAVSANFSGMIESALASFRRTLPDMGPVGDVYLVHSLGEMDGGTRQFDGVRYFIFGADMIARIHTPETQRPFFHHELFHIYHGRSFSGCDPIWCDIWSEGLAVLAAQELNPGATDEQLLLTLPAPIRPAVDANFTETICFVRARLDSLSSNDYSQLFNFRRPNERLPARSGYYVGLLIAAEARKTMSLADLARLVPEQARPVFQAAIDKLASCPG